MTRRGVVRRLAVLSAWGVLSWLLASLLVGCAATMPAGGTPSPAATSIGTGPMKAVALLTAKGHGIKGLPRFTTTGDWTLHYTYNCASFGTSGDFIVTDEGDNFGIYASELGMKGSDATSQSGTGAVKLSVDSECAWTVKATQP